MGSNKLDAGETTSVFTPLQQENNYSLPYWRNDAADTTGMFHYGSSSIVDPVSFPYMPSQIALFPGKEIHGAYQPNTHNISETCGTAMVNLNQLHNFPKPIMEPNSLKVGSTIPSMYGRELQNPEWNMKGASHVIDVMHDPVHFNSFWDPGVNKRIPLIRGTIGGGYETPSGEAHVSSISGPRIHNFVGSGGSSTYSIPNSDGPQIKNFVGSGGSKAYNSQNSEVVSIGKNDELYAAQFGFRDKVDGSFLSLGIGSNTDVQSKSDHSSREITGSGLYGAVTPQIDTSLAQQATGRSFNLGHNSIGGRSSFKNNVRGLYGAVTPQLDASRAQQATGRSFNLGHNSIGGRSGFKNNVGGYTSLENHVGGWTSSYNNFRVGGGINASPNSSQFHNVQKPEANNMQHGFPASSTRDPGIVGYRNARYPNLSYYKDFIGPCSSSSSSSRLLDSGQTAASGLTSESVKLSGTAPPTCDELQKHLTETVHKLSPESSMASSFLRFKGSSTRQEHSGQLVTASKDGAAQAVDGNAQPARRKHVQLAGRLFSGNDIAAPYGAGGGMFPPRVGVQVSKDRAAQAARSVPFPRRLGVHVNDYSAAPAAGDGLFHGSTGIKGADCHVAYGAECGQYTKEIGVQMATTGCSREGLQAQFRKDLIRPAFPTGQAFPTANRSGLSQASKVLGLPSPSLKRRAMQPPPATPRVQRRKITLPPPIQPYILSSQTVSAPFPHIKWKGVDGLPQPIGQKCMLCKRDLSFTPEGSVHQPTVPPSVAVLPCGHTFHNHCLETITPEDQSKDPPCIPCATGEI
ncbi:hypothetical protein Vadar_006355 [Vaccinium darrowii]|uniref:Uncharacterized protein n=1 Tax=Vaccinium darrowii TaxID=229202 RepID=A0ACB7YT82_9ERIC|nr:hypothetical protein Vadar_006355 [Vaccinium darrowii]